MVKKKNTGYLGNPLLKKLATPQQYTKEQLQEYIKCSQDPLYFIENYCNIVNLDHGLIKFKLYEFQKRFILDMKNNRRVCAMMPRQQGKALSLDTPVITPSGYRPIGDLEVGDYVFGRDGKQTKITFITETMYNKKMYNVKFSNGETIVACEDHLWNVERQKWKSHSSRPERTLSTKELLDQWPSYERYYVSLPNPIEFDSKEVPVDPYTLGVWLGDGHSADGRISCHASDYEHYNKAMECGEFKLDNRTEYTGRFNVIGLNSSLRKIGLLYNKHIPTDYLQNDVSVRLKLLQGLMDSDGTIMTDGSMKFYNTNEKIIEGVEFLLSSLGVKYTKKIKIGKINGVEYKECYTITFSTTKVQVVSLPRKLERITKKSHPKSNRLYIESITETQTVPCRCLQVDNEDHLFLVGKTMIPTHNTTTVAAFICWYILFNEQKTVALLAHKLGGAKEVLHRLKTMYEHLPHFLQLGVVTWNKTSIELETGTSVFCAATTGTAVTGKSINFAYLDEFAVLPTNIADEFMASVFPTLASGTTTMLTITSTPRGANAFKRLYDEAVAGTNGFVAFKATWDEVPTRDQAWLDQQRKDLGELKFSREILCTFEGSSNTLINGSTIATLVQNKPLKQDETMKVFALPIENHKYISIADVARGTENDYSTLVTIDVSIRPFKVVNTYRCNKISTEMFPDKIKGIANFYNDSYVVVETNDMGESVVNTLFNDLEYDNIFRTSASTIEGWTKKDHLGLRTTVKTKRKGCEGLKNLLETGQLEVSDANIINELSTFVAKRNTYAAETGSHDDLVMPLVLFGWLTLQMYFKDLIGVDRTDIFATKIKAIDEQLYIMGMKSGVEVAEQLPKEELELISDEYKWMFDRNQQVEFMEEMLEELYGGGEDSLFVL